jgi:Carboxypeptidase regulatory-like domain
MSTRILAVPLLLSLIFVLVFASLAFAQGGATGAISGVVQDASGAVIANAKVSVTSEATGEMLRQLTTDASGLFNATLLPVGNYTVEVNAAGFPVTKFPGLAVRITETTRMTAVIKLSTVKQVVEVQSEAEQIDTTDATTGESISSSTLGTLPLATRNFQQLLDLSAGASSNLNNAAALGRGDVRVDVNGGREDNNNYLIEGVSASDYSFGELTYTPVPNPDSIQEFKVGTSLYDASQGRNGGGNINAILKSGTSNFHGDLWEYFRNSALDASDYFIGPFDLKQNIFGGDLGGPIGQGAKLGYFYVNYQGTRQRSGDSLGTYINTSIPVLPGGAGNRTAADLAAAFSSPAVINGTTVDCPAITLTAASIDPVALALMNAQGTQFGGGGGYLIPTVAGTPGVTQTYNATNPTAPCSSTVNYGPLKITDPGKYTDNQFTANWDRDFNHGKDRLSWRFFWSDSETFEPFGADNLQVQTGYPAYSTNLNFPLDVPLRGRFGSLAETHTFSNTLVNEFRFGVNVISDALQNVPVPGTSPADLGISAVGAPDMYRFQLNTFQIGPFPNQLQSALSDSFVYLDTLGWTHGHHSFRFGGEIDRTSIRRNLPVLDNGLLYFADGNATTSSITDFQNFLEGNTFLGEAGGGVANHDYHIPAFGAFAQDDWRVSSSLTLNLGLRVEWVGAAYDDLCHLGNAVLSDANPPTSDPFVYPSCAKKYGFPTVSAASTLNSAALNNEYATVPEPRIGLAYDVGGKHSTVVRAGYGIYSVREDIGAVDNLSFTAPFFPLSGGPSTPVGSGGMGMGCMFNPAPTSACAAAGSFPLPALGTINGAYAPQASVFQGFVNCATAAPTTDTTQCPSYSGNIDGLFGLAVPLHWTVPTTQQWNLTVQRQLGGNWVAELGYVGTKGSRLRSTFDPDQPALASGTTPITLTCGNATTPCNIPGNTGTTYSIVTNTGSNALARAPYPGVNPALLEAFYPNSDSHYSGLQATVSHHFSKGLYFQSAYTYSKSIDDVSTASVAFITRVNDQNSGAASKGLSDFDHRQRFVTSFNYALPFFADRHDAMGYALGGWEVNSVIVAQSGSPITIFDSGGASVYTLASAPVATADFNSGFSCGNALNSGNTATKVANWVNPNAYLPVAVGGSYPAVVSPNGATGYGDSPRNCIIGPKQANVDLTLGKMFKLGENQNLHFRTEFFNLFNHPSFQNPLGTGTANVEDGSCPAAPGNGCNIGQITQVNGTPRLIQFSLKYSF